MPFDVPEGWEWCRMHDIASQITDGEHLTPKREEKFSGYYLISARNILNSRMDLSSVDFVSQETYDVLAKRCSPQIGDILLSCSGSVGRCCICDKNNCVMVRSVALIAVRAISSLFLQYAIQSIVIQKQIQKKQKQVAQANIFQAEIKSLLLPLPPLAEQKRIVSQVEALLMEVDKIDADATELDNALTLAKQKILDLAIRGKLVPQNPNDEPALELLKKIKAEKEAFVKAGKIKRDKHESFIFRGDDNRYYEDDGKKQTDITTLIPFDLPDNWQWVRLRNIGEIVGGGTPSTTVNAYWDNGNIAWLSPADLTGYSQMYISHGKKDITALGLQNSSAVVMPAGSLLYSSRAPIGYVVIAAGEIATNQGFKSVVPTIVEINEFYYYTLKAVTPDIKKRATGTTFKEISGSEFGATLVPLPPLAEQKRIVSQIERVFAQLETMQK
ncbi:MAG: restriction endonuclease subunit S [Candidatus Saccharimonadaceae bacterium]|nr:restriction endonuclease subunit S [Candidatus Saccharimonadaceae bacterium]